ncbi:hypothetical protein DYI20_00690 [Auritidibacter ignavus]|nr:hypothetical protein DYI20_00690 [Auritidibacter ignavus]
MIPPFVVCTKGHKKTPIPALVWALRGQRMVAVLRQLSFSTQAMRYITTTRVFDMFLYLQSRN